MDSMAGNSPWGHKESDMTVSEYSTWKIKPLWDAHEGLAGYLQGALQSAESLRITQHSALIKSCHPICCCDLQRQTASQLHLLWTFIWRAPSLFLRFATVHHDWNIIYIKMSFYSQKEKVFGWTYDYVTHAGFFFLLLRMDPFNFTESLPYNISDLRKIQQIISVLFDRIT